MPLIQTSSPSVRGLNGLHLYHYAMSNCSQKVRIVLEEKNLTWTSHHLDLSKDEHVTEHYIAINPNGVVPTLVHDGQVIIESSDIIDYLDENFPSPPLKPERMEDVERMRSWISVWDGIQPAIKTLSHEFLFKVRKLNARRELARYERLQKNEHLLEFLREFTSPQGLSKDRIRQACIEASDALRKLDAYLACHEWLAGDAYSLADISWSVNVYRFTQMRFPMEDLPSLQRWYKAVLTKPSFQRAVIDYEPISVSMFFRLYSLFRRATGSGPKLMPYMSGGPSCNQ